MSHSVALNFADGKTFFISVSENEILLDAAFRQGITLPLDCREGVCATCQGQCESGKYTQEYIDEDALSELDIAQRKILACQTRVQSNATFYFDHDSSFCNAGETLKIDTKVTHVEFISETTTLLHLEATEYSQKIDFLAGQYARLKIPGANEWRSYSFANSPNEQNQLQFLIRLLPQGLMSDYLRERCQIGQTIAMEAPLGSFYLREVAQQRPLIFVAGGTGLSAFLGMIDQISHQENTPPIHLYYGVNKEQDLCEQEKLHSYRSQISNFEYHPVIAQPNAEWRGKKGFIHEHLDQISLNKNDFDMYLCGPPPMIDAVKTWLNDHSIHNGRVFSEKFAPSHKPIMLGS